MTAAIIGTAARFPPVLRHVACILALMWSALVNGQAFFFSDTTSYVRAADLVAYKLSAGRITTAWTARYAGDLAEGDKARRAPRASAAPTEARPAGNDVRAGNIMAGRSPYIGALLWLAYVASDFWLFVLLQAATCYALIVLTLRHFGLDRPNVVWGVVVLLALGTALPYFNALLLADALAAFGILAFLLLATERFTLARRERAFLWVVLTVSLVSHLTHVVMMIAMLGTAGLLAWRRVIPLPPRATLVGAMALLAIAFASIGLTSIVVAYTFQRSPQLVPLMTARFIADGPGKRFIEHGCGGGSFAVCEIPIRSTGSLFLWSTEPDTAVYLAATPAQRARMSAEDAHFALAVLRAYPIQQGAMLLYNTVSQLLQFQALGYNESCFAREACFPALPGRVRAQLQHTLGGRDLWPQPAMTALYYAVAFAGLIVIAARGRVASAVDGQRGRDLAAWLAIGFVAMLSCAFFGGAVSEPQYRYQGRLIWLVPLFASIVFLMARNGKSGEPAR